MHPIDIGIMQGRLSPKQPQQMLAFPWDSWKKEFDRAKKVGFSSIEWLFGKEKWQNNPIYTETGRLEIKKCIAKTNIQIHSLCVFFILEKAKDNFYGMSDLEVDNTLLNLMIYADSLGVKVFTLPLMEEASLKLPKMRSRITALLQHLISQSSNLNIVIALESDLPALELKKFIQEFNHPTLGVCYDLGNAVAEGYDPVAELNILAPQIREIHIKDRINNGGSFMLGEGDVPFPKVFTQLPKHQFTIPIILETPVGEDWQAAANSNFNFVQNTVLNCNKEN
ncbi:MAG: sugar phosphate isomerase/epimerase [Magnetococcales bacterium]|nr:sugar phosphate isomerase/epimerase [Magnetococcales bacterium]